MVLPPAMLMPMVKIIVSVFGAHRCRADDGEEGGEDDGFHSKEARFILC
jgi:hypothetical protein